MQEHKIVNEELKKKEEEQWQKFQQTNKVPIGTTGDKDAEMERANPIANMKLWEFLDSLPDLDFKNALEVAMGDALVT